MSDPQSFNVSVANVGENSASSQHVDGGKARRRTKSRSKSPAKKGKKRSSRRRSRSRKGSS